MIGYLAKRKSMHWPGFSLLHPCALDILTSDASHVALFMQQGDLPIKASIIFDELPLAIMKGATSRVGIEIRMELSYAPGKATKPHASNTVKRDS
eukprot:4268316-Amphidinium_carterae.1